MKLITILTVVFISLIFLLNLLYNSCSHISKHLKTVNYIHNENYKHNTPVSNKSALINLSVEEMKNIRIRLNTRKIELEQYCEIIGKTDSNLGNVLSNMVIDT